MILFQSNLLFEFLIAFGQFEMTMNFFVVFIVRLFVFVSRLVVD